MTRGRWIGAALVATLVGGGVAAWALAPEAGESPFGGSLRAKPAASAPLREACEKRLRDSNERAAIVTRSEVSTVRFAVIGDSYSVGSGLPDLGDSWPSHLPGEVMVDGFGGSGFSDAAGLCRGVSYATRVSRVLTAAPQVVVVEGGLNDWQRPSEEIEAGATALIEALEGVPTVLVGPAPAPLRIAEVSRVDGVLAAVAADHDVPYVSAAEWELTYLDDRLHPDAAGHRVFGQRVADAIVEMGLLEVNVTAQEPVTTP